MIKADLKKYMLIGNGNEESKSAFRILAILDKILVIDCIKKNMPTWKEVEELQEYVEIAEAEKESLQVLEELEPEDRKLHIRDLI